MISGDWGAMRLPLTYDAARLGEEVMRIEQTEWDGGGRTASAFADTKAIFLKGFAAASKNPSLEERSALGRLPYARELIHSLIPSVPQKCVLSYLPAKTDVGLHVDMGEYFEKTLRIHFPVLTNTQSRMYIGACYCMKPGEVWILNNNVPHGVENDHPTLPRIHMICDYLPTKQLLDLVGRSDASLGSPCPELREKLRTKTKMRADERRLSPS